MVMYMDLTDLSLLNIEVGIIESFTLSSNNEGISNCILWGIYIKISLVFNQKINAEMLSISHQTICIYYGQQPKAPLKTTV